MAGRQSEQSGLGLVGSLCGDRRYTLPDGDPAHDCIEDVTAYTAPFPLGRLPDESCIMLAAAKRQPDLILNSAFF